MENPTAFDLNRAIQQWRENLAGSPAFRSENLNELESHLRDSIGSLQTRGLAAEEAFLVATRRIGKGGALEGEFGKVNGQAIWLDRFFWMLIGYQMWSFISGIIGLGTHNALLLGLNGVGYDFKAHGYAIPVTLFTLVQLAGFGGSLAICGWLFYRKGQRFGRWLGRLLQRRTTWVLTFVALYMLYFSINLANQGIYSMLINSIGREKITELFVSQGYSLLFTRLITVAIFTWLTLFLANKRFRLGRA